MVQKGSIRNLVFWLESDRIGVSSSVQFFRYIWWFLKLATELLRYQPNWFLRSIFEAFRLIFSTFLLFLIILTTELTNSEREELIDRLIWQLPAFWKLIIVHQFNVSCEIMDLEWGRYWVMHNDLGSQTKTYYFNCTCRDMLTVFLTIYL